MSDVQDGDSRRDWSEFSMTDVATAFLNQVGLSSDDDAVADLVAAYLEEWNAGVVDIGGLRATLGVLAGDCQLAVVSNTHDSGLVHGHFRTVGRR